MEALLYNEFILWFWAFWALVTVIMGYLVAESLQSPEETVAAIGAVAGIQGIFGLFSGGGFIEHSADALKSFFMAVLLVPAWPACYFLPLGWAIGEGIGFEWAGALLITCLVAMVGAGLLTCLWVLVLRAVSAQLHSFLASIFSVPVFGLAPLLCLMTV